MKSFTPLVVASNEMRNRLHRPDGSHKYQSSDSQFVSGDRLKVVFYDTHDFFRENIRRNDPELVRRMLDSLCRYDTFNIHCYFRFYTLFVTKEASEQEQLLFVVGLFFERDQQLMHAKAYARLLQLIVMGSNKLPQENLERLLNSILHITTEGSQILTREGLMEVLSENQSIVEVLISLLQTN